MDGSRTSVRFSGRAWIFALSLLAAGTWRGAFLPLAAQDARATLDAFEKGDSGWKARMTAMVGIARLGAEAVPALVERLKSGSPAARELSAQVLALLADPRSRPALAAALDDPEPDVRVYAIRGLSALDRDPATIALLEGVLRKDTVWAVRHAAAWALERDDAGGTAIGPALGAYDLKRMDTARLDDAAPDFALTDVQGRTYRLGEFRGRKSVLLKFYQEPL